MFRRRRRSRLKRPSSKYVSIGLSFGRQKKTINISLIKELLLWGVEIVTVLFIAIVCVVYLGYRVPVVGQSMSGSLENGEQVLVNRLIYRLIQPKQNDIIVFLPNGNDKSHFYIKRVIATPGDIIQIKDGIVMVNGSPFEEKIDTDPIENALLAEEEIEVQEDEFFVLGDNRNSSEDSRFANIGNVKREHITGKAWFRLFPWDKIGFL